eukprot:CAMPEP_0119345154 /NCGR_PEP_ID=MMETSP1333-20130426/107339_1 /TAXON_ID=418940 /ORGANISM="Scyphosphaera apsteinii, Strain RCC1455" /LENGTH=61 /DNA_ID=CAMNT_0007357611 /DNA_START=1344 /DNA_END=1529 /DNA_ORIENTATION=+
MQHVHCGRMRLLRAPGLPLQRDVYEEVGDVLSKTGWQHPVESEPSQRLQAAHHRAEVHGRV